MQAKSPCYCKNIFSLFLLSVTIVIAQQIDISRIEALPEIPVPYEMRNWSEVAKGYDSLVFDLNASGDHLPLIWSDNGGVNYPSHPRFGLQSYVGAYSSNQAEAINVIPAVISASLVGIDKSNQNGKNWVLMCEEFFNRRAEENVYLNGFVSSSGGDWWYDTMPNVFFYQLNSLYPGQGDFSYQFRMVADRWLDAINHMGGRTAPWHSANMNYRAWKLSSMTPNSSGVYEPEAAGTLSWLMFMAYEQLHEEKYRIGAEWAMEFLNSLSLNPAYEIQLPYGALVAARMNAELGTNYNVEKIVDWCFSTENNVREWGMTLGSWGGYDCGGLIGEALYDGYGFTMNGMEQVGALLPMVRYDDRFARAMGKWTLHVANASRLYYANYLPDNHQDSEIWAHQYDPNSYIAYEALREKDLNTETSPYATGDAKRGGWAATNLALYGASHVGIFGAIIDTTDVEMILQLDLLKTDYYHGPAYPSFLFYSPYSVDTTFTMLLPQGSFDLYDAVGNQFIAFQQSGSATIAIGADAALLVVLTPPSGDIQYRYNTTYVNSVAIDYYSDRIVNFPPRIKSLAAEKNEILLNDSIQVYCAATDRDGDTLSYIWHSDSGLFSGEGSQVSWKGPASSGRYEILCIVDDGHGESDTSSIFIELLDNQDPNIVSLTGIPSDIDIFEESTINCVADDPDGDSLAFTWTAASGSISGIGSNISWTAPGQAGTYSVKCRVSDGNGGFAEDSLDISVGHLVLSLPLDGDASDTSGYGNDGLVSGAIPATDRWGNTNGAYQFDGIDDYILIHNNSSLNFTQAITVAFWMRVDEFFDREQYPLSHGNWENRWKVSITNDGIRWTVKTNVGVKDVDSNTKLSLSKFYFITCVYDKSKMEIYFDGQLNGSANHTGDILPTSIDFTIAKARPDESNYNFKGILDDILLFNKALTSEEISDLYDKMTGISNNNSSLLPEHSALTAVYPNPFNPMTTVSWEISQPGNYTIDIYDVSGKKVVEFFQGHQEPGIYKQYWQANNFASGIYFIVLLNKRQISVKKCLLLK